MLEESLTVDQSIQAAYRAIRAGDAETAQRLARLAAEKDSQREEPWLILAAFADPGLSLRYLKRALQINPDSAPAREAMRLAVQQLRLKPPTEIGSDARLATEALATHADQPIVAAGAVQSVPVLPPVGTFRRVLKYTIVKAVTLSLTLAVGLFLFIVIFNLGGYVDRIFSAQIDESIGMMIAGGWLRDSPEPERTQTIDQTRWAMQEARGLHEPFLIRSFNWFLEGITLNFGAGVPDGEGGETGPWMRGAILNQLRYTLALIGLTNVLVFFSSILTALFLSRRHDGFLDRLSIFLTPITSAPNWINGLILLAIFAAWLRVLPFPRVLPITPVVYTPNYLLMTARQLVIPVAAIFIGAFFQSVYSWRSYFLIYANEDYVELARANGLPRNRIERRHILRPVLPYVITSFAMMMILIWQSSIAFEHLFRWPGIGMLFLDSVRMLNTPMALGVVVVFAYLLAITVFVLEIVYSMVDPRVRLGSKGFSVRPAGRGRRWSPVKPSGSSPRRQSFIHTAIQTGRPRFGHSPLKAILQWPRSIYLWMRESHPTLRELFRHPEARIGTILIGLLVGLAMYTVAAFPYSRAVQLWRGHSGDFTTSDWYRNPEYAPPAWINYFRSEKLPETIVLDSRKPGFDKQVRMLSDATKEVYLPFSFEFTADRFPQDVILYIRTKYAEKIPFITMLWRAPDGREIDLGGHTTSSLEVFYLTADDRMERKFRGQSILAGLFADPNAAGPVPLKGIYQFEVSGFTFDPSDQVDVEVVIYGLVHGLAGTDQSRRDLTLALLWGIPVALAFGILGAIGTSVFAMTIAAAGVWFGGWLDELIQRMTDLSMMLPTLPIVILVYLLYSKSIWVILGVVVLMNIFSSAIKNYRAAFLQIKESPYLEAAQIYGASNWRLIRKYMVPFIMPVLVPQIVILIPVFVFYEATLAYLGIYDPYIPTWGKVIYEALIPGDLYRHSYWFLGATFMLIITALAFSLLGIGLERVLNPKLRTD